MAVDQATLNRVAEILNDRLTDLTASHAAATPHLGINALDVLARHPGKYRVVALTANTQVDRLFEQCRHFLPRQAVMLDPCAAGRLTEKIRAAGLPVLVSP